LAESYINLPKPPPQPSNANLDKSESCHILNIALSGEGRFEGNWDTTARAAAGWENAFAKFNQEMSQRTANAAGSMHKDCLDAFEKAFGKNWLTTINNTNLMFWNSKDRVQSQLTIGDAGGANARNAGFYLTTVGTEGGRPQPLASVIQLHTEPGRQEFVPSTNIVLHQGWASLGSTKEQNLVLIHEAFHAVFKMGDQELADKLSASRGGVDPGRAIHEFLKRNCQP
jgi:hypothetical protein